MIVEILFSTPYIFANLTAGIMYIFFPEPRINELIKFQCGEMGLIGSRHTR